MSTDMNQGAPLISGSPTQKHRLDSIAFYILLVTVIIAPLAFWPSPYAPLDLVKTAIISLGTLVSAILYGVLAFKERKAVLPPRALIVSSKLIVLSLIVSALASIHAMKSLFGQGFEIGTVSFIAMLFVAALVAFSAVIRDRDRSFVIYAGIVLSFLVLCIIHAARFVFGSDFASFGFLNSSTSTLVGTWVGLGALSAIIAIAGLSALLFLPLSRRMRIAYWVLVILGAAGMIIVGSMKIWFAAVLVLLGLTAYVTLSRARPSGNAFGAFWKRLAWLPAIACIIALAFTWKGDVVTGPADAALGVGASSEQTLPWQASVDIISDSIKASPLLGIGPNHFLQAYTAFKPIEMNLTGGWSAEYPSAFGLFPTFAATQGLIGTCLWLILLLVYGVFGVRTLRKLGSDPMGSFAFVSSYAVSALLLILSFIYVLPHALLLIMFVMMGIAAALSVNGGHVPAYTITMNNGSKKAALYRIGFVMSVVISIVWGVFIVKNVVALAYFDAGLHQLMGNKNAAAADADFARALSFDSSDVFWQGRAEAALALANDAAQKASQITDASTTQSVLAGIADTINTAHSYSQEAIAYDPTNYYNYLSEARVSEAAATLRLTNGYENTVAAYTRAIKLYPLNPSLYLSLARFQASQNKLDDALKTVGAAIQAKNDYLDAIFLYSQIEVAKGDLPNAITAAKVAVQINPQNPLLLFQLGLLQYNNKEYDAAIDALSKALAVSKDYANAQYFLGLSYARIGRNADAIAQFTALAASNPDNQEVALILANLQAGKSPFTDAKPPVTPTPEKRSTLPIKPKK